MSSKSIFNDPTKTAPKRDSQIIRVDFEESEIGARKDHMPRERKSDDMSIRHVPNEG